MNKRAIPVREVMTQDVGVVDTTVSAAAAAAMMRRRKVAYLVVLEGTRPVGVVSTHELRHRRLPETLAPWMVSDLMVAPALSVPQDASLRTAARLMQGRSRGPLVVTGTGGHVVGIVTAGSVLSSLVARAGRPRSVGTRRVRHRRRDDANHHDPPRPDRVSPGERC